MRRILLLIIVVYTLLSPVSAAEFTAPVAPEDAQKYMPYQQESFWGDIWKIIKSAVADFNPDFTEAISVCISVICISLLISILRSMKGLSVDIVNLTGTLLVGTLLLGPSRILIQLGVETARQISDYGKLLLPVMASALAAEGGVSTSTAIYAGTALFNTILSTFIIKLITPLIFVYLAVMIAGSALSSESLKEIGRFIKWLMSCLLKTIIYIFTAYISITGVISGTTDAAALKAAKLTLSGVIPVVGSMIADASEAVLVSAGVLKNAAGIYGLLAITAIVIHPFMMIAVQYLLLKASGAISKAFEVKQIDDVVQSFTGAMGIMLAVTGVSALLFLLSVTCFMKGIA